MDEMMEGTDENKQVLAAETARLQMDGLMKSYDIDQSDIVIDQGEAAVETVINRLVRAIQNGDIEVLDGGSVRQNLRKPKGDVKQIVYKRLNGNAIKARDKAPDGLLADCAMMGSLGSIPEHAMASLDAVDLSIMQRLARLFTVV
jgi:hypothetical protein